MAKFTHLHVHTEYSLLDGLSKIEALISKALEYGMDSLAITDHGVMYGAVKFFLTAKDYEIKPIIGFEAYVATRSRFDKQANIDSDRFHLILLAKNNVGYVNLMKLTTHAHLEGFYYKPRIDMDILRECSEGLIATSACIDGEVPSAILQGNPKRAEEKAREFVDIFGKDFYLEIQDHPGLPSQKKANDGLVKLSRKLGIPLVATNDIHYVNKEDAEAQDALLAIQTQRKISDDKRISMMHSPDLYLRSQEEMISAFSQYPEAIANTQKIAKSCDVDIPVGKLILPRYPIPADETPEIALRKLVDQKAKERYPKLTEEIIKRLDYELGIICQKGFAAYFLIVQDFVNWSKSQGIRVGPGRGSAAGSLVSYVLRITSIDPLKHNIPFERFLNVERPTPPDIDLDFADDRREEVIGYITDKYGKDKVAQIITFGTIKARMAVRDIGRVLGMPYSEPDKIAKLIPFNMSIEESLKAVPELAILAKQDKYKKLLSLAKQVSSTVRHSSTHAAGLVIADRPITEYTPLQRETKGDRITTQYDMNVLDINVAEGGKAVGLMKIDLLGLRNLTILDKALKYIKSLRGVNIDLSELPIDDKETYKTIAKGETTGVFQLESAGMRRVARKLVPSRFSDVAAMVALYRPGPMQFIDEFIAGKKNQSKIKYPHPDLVPVLEETYGIAVYQEQCLQIANVMGGYSLGEADILRRAIGKKKKYIMDKEKEKFLKKAVEKKYKKETAEQVFSYIERFAGYGFNKAHSVCYAMIAYQTAYLKTHFPVEFMAALLTAETAGSSGPARDEKVTMAVKECRRMGIRILRPDINKSAEVFTVEEIEGSLEGRGIRFGLGAIKNVGEAAIRPIIEAKDMGGEFHSLTDFCQRVDSQKVNKKVVESLIKTGAMDDFGPRAAMLAALDLIREKSTAAQKQRANGQGSLFDTEETTKKVVLKDSFPEVDDFSREELLALERELLGFYLTEHPLTRILEQLSGKRTHSISQVLHEAKKGEVAKIGGVVADLRVVYTKKDNKEMAFAKMEDDTGAMEVVIFPKTFGSTKPCWIKDKILVIEGKVEHREDTISILVDGAKAFEDAQDVQKKTETKINEIKVPSNINPQKLMVLNDFLKENPGEDHLELVFVDSVGREKRMPLPFGIRLSDKLLGELRRIISTNN